MGSWYESDVGKQTGEYREHWIWLLVMRTGYPVVRWTARDYRPRDAAVPDWIWCGAHDILVPDGFDTSAEAWQAWFDLSSGRKTIADIVAERIVANDAKDRTDAPQPDTA